MTTTSKILHEYKIKITLSQYEKDKLTDKIEYYGVYVLLSGVILAFIFFR